MPFHNMGSEGVMWQVEETSTVECRWGQGVGGVDSGYV